MKSVGVDGEPELPELPVAVMREIFTRLGAKDLHRCKCVSKKWNSILCNDNFVTSYIANSAPNWAIVDRFIRVNPDLGPEFKFEFEQPPKVSSLSINSTNLGDNSKKKKGMSPPVALITSSNGVILLSTKTWLNPFEFGNRRSLIFESEEDTLYVVNPITREWVRIPKKPNSEGMSLPVGFIAEVGKTTGVLERFIIAYCSMLSFGNTTCRLTYFSSDTWEWNDMFPSLPSDLEFGLLEWGKDGVVEFDGNLIWVDWLSGIISWDKPFDSVKDKEVTLRFFAAPQLDLEEYGSGRDSRCLHVCGGHIHCVDVSGDNQDLTLWRLSDFQGGGRGEWSLVHKLCLKDVWSDNHYLGYQIQVDMIRPRLQFMHPYEPDTAVFLLGNRVVSLYLQTREVKVCATACSTKARYLFLAPVKIPSWPSSFCRSLKATNLNQQGMGLFKVNNFKEAINCYTRSITLSPNSLAYANRAKAFLKDDRYREAEDDCTLALTLDVKYFEAYWHRAIARKKRGDLNSCVEDVKFALKLKPDNQELKKLDAEVKALIKSISSEPVPTAPPVQNDALVQQDDGSEGDAGDGSAA